MDMVHSLNKGKTFERWVANWFRTCFGSKTARRGQQFAGSPDSPDVVDCIPGAHIECKAAENLNLHAAMAQAENDAAQAEIPVVIHKKNRKPVLLTIQLDHLIPFIDTCAKHLGYKS